MASSDTALVSAFRIWSFARLAPQSTCIHAEARTSVRDQYLNPLLFSRMLPGRSPARCSLNPSRPQTDKAHATRLYHPKVGLQLDGAPAPEPKPCLVLDPGPFATARARHTRRQPASHDLQDTAGLQPSRATQGPQQAGLEPSGPDGWAWEGPVSCRPACRGGQSRPEPP